MFATLPERIHVSCCQISQHFKVSKGKEQEQELKSGVGGRLLSCVPRMALQVDLWAPAQTWNLWLEGNGEGIGGQLLVTLAEAETAVPISHRFPL